MIDRCDHCPSANHAVLGSGQQHVQYGECRGPSGFRRASDPPASLEKGIEQQNDQASLAAVNQQRPRESENTDEGVDRRTLEALKQLYQELNPLYIPAEIS
jgi:hypothetical protein